MKKIIAIIFCMLLTFSLFACNNNQGNNSSTNSGETSTIINPTSSNGNGETSNTGTPTSSNGGGETSTGGQSTSSETPSSSGGNTGNDYTAEEQETLRKATNAITWQLNNGGWDKDLDTHTAKPYTGTTDAGKITNGWKKNNQPLGTIDNDGTYSEMRLIAEAYEISSDKKFKTSFDKGIAFLKNLQYPTGGFAQVYPRRGNYSDYVTFNDNAMVNVLKLLQDIAQNKTPFKKIVNDSERQNCAQMVEKAVGYIIKAQITVQGEKAAWCAQHDPTDYSPKGARAYELPSVSGSESVSIIQFLLTQKNNAEALAAAESARAWLVKHRIENMTYNKRNPPNFFTKAQGKYCWYRFYSLEDGRGFYCTREGKVYYDINEFYAADSERATGYDWAGTWLAKANLNY